MDKMKNISIEIKGHERKVNLDGANLKLNECIICKKSYLTRIKKARGFRRFPIRRIGSKTCGIRCSRKYLTKTKDYEWYKKQKWYKNYRKNKEKEVKK